MRVWPVYLVGARDKLSLFDSLITFLISLGWGNGRTYGPIAKSHLHNFKPRSHPISRRRDLNLSKRVRASKKPMKRSRKFLHLFRILYFFQNLFFLCFMCVNNTINNFSVAYTLKSSKINFFGIDMKFEDSDEKST